MNQLIRFGVFGIVGVVNTLFDLLIWKTILSLWGQNLGFVSLSHKVRLNTQSLAHIISFMCGTILSYFLNSTITFANRNRTAGQLTFFFGVSVFSLAVSTVFLKWLTESRFGAKAKSRLIKIESLILPNQFRFVSRHWDLICKGITIIVSLLTNYIGYSLLVFN